MRFIFFILEFIDIVFGGHHQDAHEFYNLCISVLDSGKRRIDGSISGFPTQAPVHLYVVSCELEYSKIPSRLETPCKTTSPGLLSRGTVRRRSYTAHTPSGGVGHTQPGR